MIPIQSLMEEAECIEFLNHQQQRIFAPNLKVTASMMMKKYAQVLPSQVLDSMLWEEKAKIIPLSSCTISNELEIEIDDSQVKRTDSRKEAWEELFAHHILPLLQAFHQVTNLPTFILWENVAVRINSYFRKAVERYPDEHQVIGQLAEEFNQLDGRYFHCAKHPMQSYLTDPNSLSEQKVRSTCCYFHKLEKTKELTHCLVCPLSNKECSS
ncbi:IucA/IucC family C-terminal-domain containing protein [Halobacillus sp. K22]|uniref:IucA/IucC family C-terminal-domain containing protein n=1 Tax=Halobacillus sp. K22 TaxID=3457431 RepID=UPI003FCC4C9B